MIALAAVFVLPVMGTALGLPLGEWLAILSGERSLPDFWLRGEKSHFERKPREPKPEESSIDLVRGEGFTEELPPPTAPEAPQAAQPPAATPPAPASAHEPERTFAPDPEPARANRPPRLRRMRMGSGIQSWFKGDESEPHAETRAYLAAEPPPQAAPKPEPAKPAEPAPPPKPVEVAKKETPPPPPPPAQGQRPRGRPVPGRTGPVTAAAPAPQGTVGPAAAAPTIDAPLPPPQSADFIPDKAPTPNVDGPYPCVVERTRAEHKVRVTQTDARYPVSGNTASEIKAAVAAAVGPGRGPGRTDGYVEPSCSFKQEGPLCTPLCSVVVTLKRLLPELAARVPPELAPRWRRFVERVETHESSHISLFTLEGNEMLKRLNELPRSECKNIQKVVELEAAVVRSQSKQRHQSYDATCKADPSCSLEF